MQRDPVIKQLMALSSGTIANLTTLTDLEEIEQFQGVLVGQARIWLEQGVVTSNQPWTEVWDLFKHFFEIFEDMEAHANESTDNPESSPEPSIQAPALNWHRIA